MKELTPKECKELLENLKGRIKWVNAMAPKARNHPKLKEYFNRGDRDIEALSYAIKAIKENEDVKETYRNIIDEKCHGDEIHCTCVPALRTELKALKEEIENGDYWMKRFKDFNEGGGCPHCFETDEAGHKEGCYVLELETKLKAFEEKAYLILDKLSKANKEIIALKSLKRPTEGEIKKIYEHFREIEWIVALDKNDTDEKINGRADKFVKAISAIIPPQSYDKGEHYPHPDTKAHDHMTMHKIAGHLGVELWKAMEIARWTSTRPKLPPQREVSVEDIMITLKSEELEDCRAYEPNKYKHRLRIAKAISALIPPQPKISCENCKWKTCEEEE